MARASKPPGRSLDSRSGGDAQRRCGRFFQQKFAMKMHGISIGVLTNSLQLAVFFFGGGFNVRFPHKIFPLFLVVVVVVVVCEKPAQEQIKISGSLAVYRLF